MGTRLKEAFEKGRIRRAQSTWAVCPLCGGDVYASQVIIQRWEDGEFQNRTRAIVYCLDCDFVQDGMSFGAAHGGYRSDLRRRVKVAASGA